MRRPVLATLLLGLASCPASSPPAPIEFSGSSMGTTWCVKLAALEDGIEYAQLEAELTGILGRVDERMSTYRADSELSRFNASRSTDWFPVSSDTASVVAAGLAVSARTGGAFDVTVGPLVNLWGFGPEARANEVPTEEELTAARASTGYTLLEARVAPPALRMRSAERYVDLSAIAKGFAVDALAEHLAERGITDYLVELGGELRARGRRSPRAAWRVAVEGPGPRGVTRSRTIELEDCAVATSGDYRNFRTLAGERFGHVLDPRSARPTRRDVGSATVVCDTAMEADALATALMVLGAEEGMRLAAREGLAVHLVVRSERAVVSRSTPAFEALVVTDAETGPADTRALPGIALAGLLIMILAMTGLGAGRILRGRPLKAGCGKGDIEPDCSDCEHRVREV